MHYPAFFENNVKCVSASYGILNATFLSILNNDTDGKTGLNSTTFGFAGFIIYYFLRYKYKLVNIVI